MLYTIRHCVPRTLNGTERPAFSPLNEVTAFHWGVSAIDSLTVEPGARLEPDAGSCLITVPGVFPGAGTATVV